MQTIHIFFPLDENPADKLSIQELESAVRAVAGEQACLENGNILNGCLAGSAYWNTRAKVLTIETDEDQESAERRWLKPLASALRREFDQRVASGRFSVGMKRLFTNEPVKPRVYCMRCPQPPL
jgi:hypothetical protein